MASTQAELSMFVMYQSDLLTQNMNEVFFVTTSVSIVKLELIKGFK